MLVPYSGVYNNEYIITIVQLEIIRACKLPHGTKQITQMG
jgi:hypothetical protein